MSQLLPLEMVEQDRTEAAALYCGFGCVSPSLEARMSGEASMWCCCPRIAESFAFGH